MTCHYGCMFLCYPSVEGSAHMRLILLKGFFSSEREVFLSLVAGMSCSEFLVTLLTVTYAIWIKLKMAQIDLRYNHKLMHNYIEYTVKLRQGRRITLYNNCRFRQSQDCCRSYLQPPNLTSWIIYARNAKMNVTEIFEQVLAQH